MKAELTHAGGPTWAAFLAEAKHDFYHLPAYVELCAAQEKGEARALVVDDGAQRMLLPVILRDAPGGARDATSPYGYGGPLVAGSGDATFLRGAMVRGVERLREEGIVSLFVRMHPLLNPEPPV